MKHFLTCVFWSFSAVTFGQAYKSPQLHSTGNSAKDFAPSGWIVSDSIEGDLNKDKLIDVVFILKRKDSILVKDIDGRGYRIQPQIMGIAVRSDSNNFSLSAVNKKLLIDFNFPPTNGTPFNSMTIENNVLTIVFSFDYINGNFYFYTYKFRFQNGTFQLIGGDVEYVTRRTMNYEKASYNFMTKKWSLTIGIHSDDDPPKLIEKTEWFDLKIETLKTFKTMGMPGTWKLEHEFGL